MSEASIRLEGLLADAESLLAVFVESHLALLPEPLRGPTLVAWPTVRDRFGSVRAALRKPTARIERGLETVGLTGPELVMKVAGYAAARDQLETQRRQPKPPPRGLGWLFQRVFAWLNTILGSLSSVIPGVDAIKEFKEAIENGIEDNS